LLFSSVSGTALRRYFTSETGFKRFGFVGRNYAELFLLYVPNANARHGGFEPPTSRLWCQRSTDWASKGTKTHFSNPVYLNMNCLVLFLDFIKHFLSWLYVHWPIDYTDDVCKTRKIEIRCAFSAFAGCFATKFLACIALTKIWTL